MADVQATGSFVPIDVTYSYSTPPIAPAQEPPPSAPPQLTPQGYAYGNQALQDIQGIRMQQPSLALPGGGQPAAATPNYVDDGSMDTAGHQCRDFANEPLVPKGGNWNGAQILSRVSQLETNEPSSANDQERRCGQAAVLAGAVMAGPDATARLVERLADSPQVSDPRERMDLYGLRQRILDGTATHGDLSRLQQYMYQAYSRAAGGTDADGMTVMEQDLADKTDVPPEQNTIGPDATLSNGEGLTRETPTATRHRVGSLKNGQSFVLNVKMDPKEDEVHHFVTVGRDQAGRTYVYDPYPRLNQPNIIYQDKDSEAFNHYTDGSVAMSATNNNVPTHVNTLEGGTMTFDPPFVAPH